MTDIVERLRRMAPHPSAYDEREAAVRNEAERREAADVIERLRMALRINGLRWGHTHKEIDALIADQDTKP